MGNVVSIQNAYNSAPVVKLEETPVGPEGTIVLNSTDNYYYMSHAGQWIALDEKKTT